MDLNLDMSEKDWRNGLTKAKNLNELVTFICYWEPYVDDAMRVVQKMKESDFQEWKEGLKIERSGTYAGDEWADKYMTILMPENLMKASMISEQFKAPFAIVLKRLKDEGMLKLTK